MKPCLRYLLYSESRLFLFIVQSREFARNLYQTLPQFFCFYPVTIPQGGTANVAGEGRGYYGPNHPARSGRGQGHDGQHTFYGAGGGRYDPSQQSGNPQDRRPSGYYQASSPVSGPYDPRTQHTTILPRIVPRTAEPPSFSPTSSTRQDIPIQQQQLRQRPPLPPYSDYRERMGPYEPQVNPRGHQPGQPPSAYQSQSHPFPADWSRSQASRETQYAAAPLPPIGRAIQSPSRTYTPHSRPYDVLAGRPNYPSPAPRRELKARFTKEEDALLRELKEDYITPKLSWRQIADFFPGRKSGTLQVRYCTKIRAKDPIMWSDDAVSPLSASTASYHPKSQL